jgi:hypothetical protein
MQRLERLEVKAALVGVLVVFAAFQRSDVAIWLIVLFGAVNVVFTPPGTGTVRAVALAATLVLLIVSMKEGVPNEAIRVGSGLVIWLIWPPAFMVAWALGKRQPGKEPESITGRRVVAAALIAAVAVGSLVFRQLVAAGLQQTSALFIGIPALLAIVVVFAVSPRSAVGVACKAVTIGLLVSLVFLGEGFLCVAMSAPLFYLVAIAVAKGATIAVAGRNGGATTLTSVVILLVTVPMSLEGTTSLTTIDRSESVTVSRIVPASSAGVERALRETPRFDRALPLYLRAGFPRVTDVRIDREAGERWILTVRGGEMRLNGMEPRTGELTLAVDEARPGLVRWHAVSDTSHMTHFLMWREVAVAWEPVTADTSRVSWTFRYERGLDPAWYFGPMERYAVRLAAGYLIDAVATP